MSSAQDDLESHLDDLARTAWGELAPPLAEHRDDNAVVDCGWGRLVFGQTFGDPADVAEIMRAEKPGSRDICLYATEPHVVVRSAPNELFIDPSHTYRIDLRHDLPEPRHILGVHVRRIASRGGCRGGEPALPPQRHGARTRRPRLVET